MEEQLPPEFSNPPSDPKTGIVTVRQTFQGLRELKGRVVSDFVNPNLKHVSGSFTVPEALVERFRGIQPGSQCTVTLEPDESGPCAMRIVSAEV